MPRFNKIFAGPVTETLPQAQERICDTSVLPGTLVVESGAKFAPAGANSGEKLYVVQDNYLALKGVDDAWPAGDRIAALELLDDQFFNVRVPTGVNVARGAKLASNAAAKLALATTGQNVALVAEEAFNNNTGSDQLVRARVARRNVAVA